MNFSERFDVLLKANTQLYEVNDLVKSKPHFIPRGSFARMINFKDHDPAKIEKRKQTLVKKSEQEILSMMRRASSRLAPTLKSSKTATNPKKKEQHIEPNTNI